MRIKSHQRLWQIFMKLFYLAHKSRLVFSVLYNYLLYRDTQQKLVATSPTQTGICCLASFISPLLLHPFLTISFSLSHYLLSLSASLSLVISFSLTQYLSLSPSLFSLLFAFANFVWLALALSPMRFHSISLRLTSPYWETLSKYHLNCCCALF